jgi:hypothetical protein
MHVISIISNLVIFDQWGKCFTGVVVDEKFYVHSPKIDSELRALLIPGELALFT